MALVNVATKSQPIEKVLNCEPSPRVGNFGRRALSIIGIQQVVTNPAKPSCIRTSEATVSPSLARLSWSDMNSGRSHFYLI